ncbi:WAP four-disulfide core domain protein 1-like [Uloborus diversus]|uniref:WAP four-disulfide core domain protein 1-like n=1 Tax=Uloborus diversus TaxID=327109 RepID=UPI0024090E2C|nr:WAP four-disulfide core domain protein 1-like [Uloborus diversus]
MGRRMGSVPLFSVFLLALFMREAFAALPEEQNPLRPISPDKLQDYLTDLLEKNAWMRWCPAPHLPLDGDLCRATVCKDDTDCQRRNQSCCFNGCVLSCMERMDPAPVIDWDQEPEAPPVRKEGTAVLHCTTSPRPAPSEPVGCPKGYVCRIEEPGDPLQGRPGTGICVPQPQEQRKFGTEEDSILKENTRKQTVYLPGGCVLSEDQYQHMRDFMSRSYVTECLCVEGSVECKVHVEKL